jgi:hypothetical protein
MLLPLVQHVGRVPLTLAAQAYDGRMKHRTPAYWPTRIMLAAAFLLPVAVALLWLSAPQPVAPPLHDDRIGWVGPVIIAVGVALWLIGLVCMIRIFRGPRDEPRAWRFRDR